MATYLVTYWTGHGVVIDPLQADSFLEAVALAEKRHRNTLLGVSKPIQGHQPGKDGAA